ncbi:MAG: UDP-N-acetylmuramate dehydrogenase [Oscillospiraceae bacterium]|nr:UDP-N-acetylmuramate dehydrogenase [Oscillospiraceae bacterium]
MIPYKIIEEIKQTFPSIPLLENEPMKNHCSFRSGGPVRVLAVPPDEASLVSLCAFLREHEITPYLLGNGTNVVFPDEGAEDLFVLSTGAMQSVSILPDGDLCVSAGLPLSRLAAFAQEHSLTGLEFASGIPGSVGGGVLMNAGAYGGELKDVIVSVRCLDLADGSIREVPASECAFGYRQSCFQNGGKLILSAKFRLAPGDREAISARMKELNQRRRDKQPLDLPSAGSAFRRPEGYFAAALIEECGLKGVSVGGAQVSEKHAGFIVNTGNATTEDLRTLLSLVRDEVYRQKHILLTPEIILVSPSLQ